MSALWYTMGDGSESGLGVLRVCGLLSVSEVGCKEVSGVLCEVEVVSKFLEELTV